MKIKVTDRPYEYLSDNSQEVDETTAFLATFSSEKYIDDAKKRGAKYIITPHALHEILDITLKLVGVTGTNGKTTTTAAIYSLLTDLGHKTALLGTRGFYIDDEQIKPKGLTTPSLFEIYLDIAEAKKRGCEYFVMEVSSHAIAQKRIEGLEFALKVHTNITSDHLDYHGSLKEYIRVKNSFFQDDGLKLINRDDSTITPNIIGTQSYAIENPATLKVSAYTLAEGIDASLLYMSKEEGYFHSDMFGRHNLYNLLAAIGSVKMLLERPLLDICEKVENFGGVRGRCEIVSRKPLVVIDFAHTEDGMKKIFEAFLGKRIVSIFGAGGERDRSKRAPMGRVAEKFSQRFYITSDNPRSEDPARICQDILEGVNNRERAIVIVDRREALEQAVANLQDDEILLVLGKGDEEYIDIGGEKIPFSDREIVERLINLKNQN